MYLGKEGLLKDQMGAILLILRRGHNYIIATLGSRNGFIQLLGITRNMKILQSTNHDGSKLPYNNSSILVALNYRGVFFALLSCL